MNPYIQIIAAFFGSLGFALLFNLRGQWLFFTALGGGLSWCVYLISGSFISHSNRYPLRSGKAYLPPLLHKSALSADPPSPRKSRFPAA